MDAGCETLVLTLMTLGTDADVVRCAMAGPPTPFMYVLQLHADKLSTDVASILSSVQHLRDLKDFLGIQFKVKAMPSSTPDAPPPVEDHVDTKEDQLATGDLFYFSCVGSGFTNVSRKVG